MAPDHLGVAHAVAVPGLTPGVELKPAHDELSQPVPVIFIAGACNKVASIYVASSYDNLSTGQRHWRVVNLALRVIPEAELLHKLLPSDNSLPIFSERKYKVILISHHHA